MKIDMSPEAIDRRLKQVEQLRRACLSLASSSAGRDIMKTRTENRSVRRTSQALGR